MATPTLNQDLIVTAAYKILVTDGTLTTLATITKGARRPKAETNPLVTIHMHSANVDTTRLEDFVLQATAYVDLYNDGSVDVKKTGTIMQRISHDLANVTLTVSGGRTWELYEENKSPILWNGPGHPEESYQAVRYRMSAIPTT